MSGQATTMQSVDLKMFVGGNWIASASGEVMQLKSPSTGKPVATVPRGTREDVSTAVAAAQAAQPRYARSTAFERCKLCHQVADVVRARREALARHLAMEQGKPYHAEALGEVDVAEKMFRMAAEDVTRLDGAVIPSEDQRKRIITSRVPRGVYGVITPWNFPYAIPTEYLSAALATGNAVVWAPAPTTAGCAVRLMECIVEAEVPDGVINLVTGEGAVVGDEIAGHAGIDAIGMTGSPSTGLTVSRRAAGKPQLLELGGNSPVVVLADADIKRAAQIAGRGAFWNAGQICDSTERILVHRRTHDEFLEELLRVAGEFRMGDSLDEKTTLGPVHTEQQLARIGRHLDDAIAKGAKILVGGGIANDRTTGQFYPATVVDGISPESLLNTEETFGPVAPVLTFDDEADAITAANAGSTGLVASVFTNDLGRAFRFAEQLHAGIVNINEGSAYWQPHIPFGGYSGKKSGIGRLGGRYTLEEMTQIKTLVIDVGEPM